MNKTSFDRLTRRGFMKGTLAVGAAASLFGCSKAAEYSPSAKMPSSNEPEQIFYGSSGHNCGGRCVSRAIASSGRIHRILTDESTHAADGTFLNPESRNWPQTRACARCRAYKYRLYHPGRLLYPLKQTKKRGDLSGFVRISWEQALKEIATKHKAVVDKYSSDGIYSIYAWGAATGRFQGASGGPLGAGGAGGFGGAALRYMGGAQSSYFGSYSTHQYRYLGVGYTGMDENVDVNSVAKYASNVVLWGDNRLSTSNPVSYSYVRGFEDMKTRKKDAKVYFIGPEFVDGGITLADEWVVSKPFTDPALVAGMVYHMLDNTFNLKTGSLKSNPWLDINYLDTMVYGFFDSPEYSVTESTGDIQVPAVASNRKVSAVPAGRSYVSWVLGNNVNAKTYAQLGAAANYTASRFGNTKRWMPCSYKLTRSATQYKTKQEYTVPKTPEWASAITGVPVAKIKELAELFAKKGPITSTWSGGQQKQADGIQNLFAVQMLHIITKNVNVYGSGLKWNLAPAVKADPGALKVDVTRKYEGFINNEKAEASCTAWHTAIKMIYADELLKNGYRAKYIPNWPAANRGSLKTGDGDIYWDDSGTKTFIQWNRDENGKIKTYKDDKGNEFYDWVGRTGISGTGTAHAGQPVYSGIRLLYNTGGNIFINQHENSNDSREMLEALPLNKYDEPDSFCLVSFDNFMSPTPRWSDYVLPAATSWEQQDLIAPTNGTEFYLPQVSTPPGESKSTWEFTCALLKAYEQVAPEAKGAAKDFAGGVEDTPVETFVRNAFDKAKSDPASPFFGKTWDEYLKNPYLPAKPQDDFMPKPVALDVMDNFRKADLKKPFIKNAAGYTIKTNEISQGGYGNQFCNTATAPKASLRYQVFSPVLVWQYENRFSKWHGYLPENKRGQQHKDIEGDRFVVEIPLYYAYEDYFLEAYSGKHTDLPFLMTTTHNRYRSHSSMAENPMLRELTHRVPGQNDNYMGYFEANDYGDYSMMANFKLGGSATIPELNRTILDNGIPTAANKSVASYSEIWINETDGKEILGIKDGDLVQVENPIGAVRCVAKLSKRCARGFVGLHQGCWYDPRPLPNSYGHDYVDVGGNCNTLMASQPSRIDHGNGQQSAMVKIVKVTGY